VSDFNENKHDPKEIYFGDVGNMVRLSVERVGVASKEMGDSYIWGVNILFSRD